MCYHICMICYYAHNLLGSKFRLTVIFCLFSAYSCAGTARLTQAPTTTIKDPAGCPERCEQSALNWSYKCTTRKCKRCRVCLSKYDTNNWHFISWFGTRLGMTEFVLGKATDLEYQYKYSYFLMLLCSNGYSKSAKTLQSLLWGACCSLEAQVRVVCWAMQNLRRMSK